jgi:hypothetical protein
MELILNNFFIFLFYYNEYILIPIIMSKKNLIYCSAISLLLLLKPALMFSQDVKETVLDEKLFHYHNIHLNAADKTILPWYSADQGRSFDFVINRVWEFWNTMRTDKNGLPYYMNHQVWRADFNDRRGIGGDQFSMALSSWNLFYGYSGNENVKEEMKFIADYYLTHSLSRADAAWPDIPYPYNTLIYSGIYDGDMVIGKGFSQPDKAGSFGLELLKLYKMTTTTTYPNITDKIYLDAAVKIANTLASHVVKGDENNSPLPFKVNAVTGEIGRLLENSGNGKSYQLSCYTSNWSGTMELFLNLIDLKAGDTESYRNALTTILEWMKKYPLRNNKWGPFFEDVPGWSDTQINAVTFAQFMMNHQEFFPDWKKEVKGIFEWVYKILGNKNWEKYGVTVINEQTAYQVPGNSHTSRQASAELQYAALSGDQSSVSNAIRQLSWTTYMVDDDGKNCYPNDEIWMTDGYGDYVRHYLRAMAWNPDLAPSDQTHLLSSTSVIQLIEYPQNLDKFQMHEAPVGEKGKTLVRYRTFDEKSAEKIKMPKKPGSVLVNEKAIPENDKAGEEWWSWKPLSNGGLLTVNHVNGNRILVLAD